MKARCPFLFKKPNLTPAHDCGSVCGMLFSAKSGRNGVPGTQRWISTPTPLQSHPVLLLPHQTCRQISCQSEPLCQ
jgi:hypothetical protein